MSYHCYLPTLCRFQLALMAVLTYYAPSVAMAQDDFLVPDRHTASPENHDHMPAMAATHDDSTKENDDALQSQGMGMNDDFLIGMLLIDQLEAYNSRNQQGQQWDIEGWYGSDMNRLWLFAEGDHQNGQAGEGSLEGYWSRAVGAFWNLQLGAREDYGAGPSRHWAAFGVQGLAPYWFEVKASGYLDPNGRIAVHLRTKYELLFTQRLILQPALETNFYSKTDSARGIGSGLSDLQLGLRLRYEFHRQFAPYVGINWLRLLGNTAHYARAENLSVRERQFILGVRLWF